LQALFVQDQDCKNCLKFMKASKNEQLKIMKDYSGLGVMMFCACLTDLDDFFPIIDVEFDCRGGIQFNGDSVTGRSSPVRRESSMGSRNCISDLQS